MRFLFPGFLAALGFLAIPIIVHLFNFVRYKKIHFSNVHFLKEVKEQTQSRSRLKHLLILAARLLAVLFLVFAFAQPYIPIKNSIVKEGSKAVSIYIDNSFSMESIGKNGTLLDEAKKDALDVLKSFSSTDKFQLLTNDFSGKHQHWVNKKIFSEMLDEVKISPAVRSFQEIIDRQKDMFESTPDPTQLSYIFSDFQKGDFNLVGLKPDTNVSYQLVPLSGNKVPNVYIDSCWFNTPARQFNQPEVLEVRLINTGDQDAENIPIKLQLNGEQRAVSSTSIKARGNVTIPLSFTHKESGLVNGQVQITDYPISYDNTYYFSYEVKKKIKLLIINQEDENSYLNKLFLTDNLFEVTQATTKNIDYGSFNHYDLLIASNLDELSSGLSDQLKQAIENGLNVLVFPGTKIQMEEYNAFLRTFSVSLMPLDTAMVSVSKIDYKHPLYKDVFDVSKMKNAVINLPQVNKHYPLSTHNQGNQEILINLSNNDDFLVQFSYGKGNLFFCASPLTDGYSNFQRHAIFVPTLYRIALSGNTGDPIFYTIGHSRAIVLNSSRLPEDPVFHIQSLDGKSDFIAQTSSSGFGFMINADKQIKEAGNYFIKGNAGDTLKGVSFNYNRTESRSDFYTSNELESGATELHLNNLKIIDKGVKNMAAALLQISKGTQLWKWCVIFALLCLTAEIAIIRWMKG